MVAENVQFPMLHDSHHAARSLASPRHAPLLSVPRPFEPTRPSLLSRGPSSGGCRRHGFSIALAVEKTRGSEVDQGIRNIAFDMFLVVLRLDSRDFNGVLLGPRLEERHIRNAANEVGNLKNVDVSRISCRYVSAFVHLRSIQQSP